MFFDQKLPSASSWTYLTKREKADNLSHYTDILVKDHLTGLVASTLGKIFRTSTTKRLKKRSKPNSFIKAVVGFNIA